ncbi:MAG: hypothetical protein ACK48U_02690 [Planctomyces sp.]|jgi:hypothetical protein
MSLIQTPEELADAIRNDPQRVAVAECLHRINRFGGQAKYCTVLQHSLSVYDRLAGTPVNVRLWGLLHDCHEILTGDVQRLYQNSGLTHQQNRIDGILREVLGITLSADDVLRVLQADIAAGTYEFAQVTAGRRSYHHATPIIDWAHHVRVLLQEVTR